MNLRTINACENEVISIKYCNVVYEPSKTQIKGDALTYLLKFIEDCFLEETMKEIKVQHFRWLQARGKIKC